MVPAPRARHAAHALLCGAAHLHSWALASAGAGLAVPHIDFATPAASASSDALPPLKFAPRTVSAQFRPLRTDASGKLWEVTLDSGGSYRDGAPLLVELTGSPRDAGLAYGKLLANESAHVYAVWISSKLPAGVESDTVLLLLDWLWEVCMLPHTPAAFVEELEGLEAGGALMGVPELDRKVRHLLVLSALPADSQNIQELLAREWRQHPLELEASGMGSSGGDRLARLASALAALTGRAGRREQGFCDFFAAWGQHTEDGRLLSSRNLDFDKATGIARHKLVTVYRLDGQVPYATFGFAGFYGALAGFSGAGITVSEANLDNSEVSFDAMPWPLRLRWVMSQARGLAQARQLWDTSNNSAAFNFLIGSASEPGAVALEAIAGYSGEFAGGSAVEAAATYQCTNGSMMDGVACHWPGSSDRVSIGRPLPEAVWRTNHALHPRIMKTQEPLWNDTVWRYEMMRAAIGHHSAQPQRMGLKAALNITARLGQKGADYTSCAPANFKTGDASNILSVVYDASKMTSLVAWEDGAGAGWMPAACNAYVAFPMQRFFAPSD